MYMFIQFRCAICTESSHALAGEKLIFYDCGYYFTVK